MNNDVEVMWDKFIFLLNKKQPLPKTKDNKGGKHVNFLGSIEKYKNIFIEANKGECDA